MYNRKTYKVSVGDNPYINNYNNNIKNQNRYYNNRLKT